MHAAPPHLPASSGRSRIAVATVHIHAPLGNDSRLTRYRVTTTADAAAQQGSVEVGVGEVELRAIIARWLDALIGKSM